MDSYYFFTTFATLRKAESERNVVPSDLNYYLLVQNFNTKNNGLF